MSEGSNRSTTQQNGRMGAVAIPFFPNGLYISAGDANQAAELRLAKWLQTFFSLGSFERVILKVSHHGSETSTSEEFLKRIRPTEAWISVGLNNRYGHPSPNILNRLHALRIPILRTDYDGGISLKRNGNKKSK